MSIKALKHFIDDSRVWFLSTFRIKNECIHRNLFLSFTVKQETKTIRNMNITELHQITTYSSWITKYLIRKTFTFLSVYGYSIKLFFTRTLFTRSTFSVRVAKQIPYVIRSVRFGYWTVVRIMSENDLFIFCLRNWKYMQRMYVRRVYNDIVGLWDVRVKHKNNIFIFLLASLEVFCGG